MSTNTEKYRENAGVLVFNSLGQVLVGERIGKPGAWQFPQGGVDAGEDATQAAIREMYEEIGLKEGQDVTKVLTITEPMPYKVPGKSWLKDEGYVGQSMIWTLFYYNGENIPPCNLSGLQGEKPEFSQVKWTSWDEIIKSIVEFKKPVYTRLFQLAAPQIQQYLSNLKKFVRL
eukprot:c7985_g1_i1.p1 GENE.c7985_g1_i1~~c7985_g1_i1.p1  ORF type:complete len:173 (-),score=62.92 c7985_g1_i1:86-604(-)